MTWVASTTTSYGFSSERSGSSPSRVTNATTRLERDLEPLGVTSVIPRVVSSARVGRAKPVPAIFRVAVQLVGVPANRYLFVDDAPENVPAAQAAATAMTLGGISRRRQSAGRSS